MDFYGRQEQARRASRWLVVAFIVAVAVVVLAVNAVVLMVVVAWTTEASPRFITPGDCIDLHPNIFWATTALVTALIVGASLRKIVELRAGGGVVSSIGSEYAELPTALPARTRYE